jgi:hypothetical protein
MRPQRGQMKFPHPIFYKHATLSGANTNNYHSFYKHFESYGFDFGISNFILLIFLILPILLNVQESRRDLMFIEK